MRATTTSIAGLWTIHLKEIDDDRGIVRELFRASSLTEAIGTQLGPWTQIGRASCRERV